MPTFPQFASLPVELQRGIWQSVLDEAPEPVVEISNTDKLAWGTDRPDGRTSLNQLNSDEVYLNTNALMHVCRVSREMARKQLKFSRVEEGACLDPYRHFDPEFDALYISEPLDGSWSDVLRDAWPAATAKIRHLALNEAQIYDGPGLAGFVDNLGLFSSLRKVSLVCADDWAELREYDPDGRVRYRLVDYPKTETMLETACQAADDQYGALEVEAWSLAKSFRDRLIHEFVSCPGIAYEIPPDEDSPPYCGSPPYDKATGKLFFDIGPGRIEAIPESIPKELAKEAYCATAISGLRKLLDDFFERLGCSPYE